MFLKNIIIFSILLSSLQITAQEWNYARVSVVNGGRVPFNFNSINKLKNGITLTDYTVIGITMVDSNQVGHDLTGFELQFRAFNGATQIVGENPANFLPLSEIEVEASDNGLSAAPGAIIFNDGMGGPQELDQVYKNCVEYTEAAATGAPLFNSLDASTHQINITYRCGNGGSLLGMPSDYYSVEIEFQLIPTGPGF